MKEVIEGFFKLTNDLILRIVGEIAIRKVPKNKYDLMEADRHDGPLMILGSKVLQRL